MRLIKDNKIDSEFSLYWKGNDIQIRERESSFVKRPFDLLLSLIGLVVSFPLWVIVAIAIWLEDRRPILYSQKRLGRNGKEFQLLKFRSMIKDAEQQTGPVWSNKDDHRITKVGRILRKTALDELPQLLNILKGDMSFVGPRAERPELAREIEREIPRFNLRLLVRPGLTGLAQVCGKYNTIPRNKLRYDLLYIRNQSFLLDLKLILLSFWITFTFRWADTEKKIDKLIGQIMLEEGVITQEQLVEALEHQRVWGGKIGESLIAKGYIAESELIHFLNVQVTLNGRGNWSRNRNKFDNLIGKLMLEEGVITQEQLIEALEHQRVRGGKLGENLISKGCVSESDLSHFLKKQWK